MNNNNSYTVDTKITWTSNVGRAGDAGELQVGDLLTAHDLAAMSDDEVEEVIYKAIYEDTTQQVDIGWEVAP